VGQASSLSAAVGPKTGGTPVPLPFTGFDKSRPAAIKSRHLPHWQQEGVTYFVTFRLADSLPKEVYEQWRHERETALRTVEQASSLSQPLAEAQAEGLAEEFREKLEAHLDEGRGECWLQNPAVAGIVEKALRHFDGERYLLGIYVIMPNHVHLFVRPVMGHTLSEILHSWKSFTAKEANHVLGRTGGFWQDESFDHIIRDEQSLERFGRYIRENPIKAGLREGLYILGGGLACRPAREGLPSDSPSQTSPVGHASSLSPVVAQETGGTPVPLAPIRFGLAAIKGVGEVAVESVLKARREGGPFKTLFELCERVDTRTVSRKTLEAFIKSGACDSFGQTRATLMAQTEQALTRAANIHADRQRGQSSLFGMLGEESTAPPEANLNLPEWPQHELLAHEKELLGFYVTGHPLTPYAPILEHYALASTGRLPELSNRSLTRIGGLIAAVQQGVSKKSNKPYLIATLEDLEGSVQVLCLNENYDKYRELLTPNRAVLVIGEVNTGEDKPKIFPQEILPLEDAPRRYTKQVHLRLQTAHLKPEQLETVRDLVAAHRGKCPLFLCFQRPGGEVIFVETHESFSVMPSTAFQQAADAMFGEATYYAKVDTSLPERQQRRWERRAENGENGN
jgi:REP element-mobilizing transposase RayT